MQTGDVGLFSCFDLGVNRIDDLGFLFFTLGKISKDAKAMDYAAGRKFYTTAIVPFL